MMMQQLGVGLGFDLCWELGNLGQRSVTVHVHYPDLSAIYQTYHRTHATPRSPVENIYFSVWFQTSGF